MAYGTVSADVIQSSVQGVSLGAGNATTLKNRIINGAMVISQRYGTASTPVTNALYVIDRFRTDANLSGKLTAQQLTASPPVGFSSYLGLTSQSAYSVAAGDYFALIQGIEGYNIADLGWGTANAKTVTLSFWVQSSLTGTFGGCLYGGQAYPFTYTITTANTWQLISITIAGSTSGAWAKDNSLGLNVQFGLGVGSTYSATAGAWTSGFYYSATGATSVVGTNGATFYITGVQLEVGSYATGFEYRQYGQELALCQRYCYVQNYSSTNSGTVMGVGFVRGGTVCTTLINFPVTMRTAPSLSSTSGSGYYHLSWGGNDVDANAIAVTGDPTSPYNSMIYPTGLSGLSAGQGGFIKIQNSAAQAVFSAEL